MAISHAAVEKVIHEFLERVNKPATELSSSTSLYGEGLGLDSLETAELSAVLEDEFGSDPFSAGGELPSTIGEITAYYDERAASA